jgi:ring-1,2-phenylacetyl-CoA epoxidase subunit PaaD
VVSGTFDGSPPESARVARAWQVLGRVLDPELPTLSVRDLGIVREVHECTGVLEITLTPTYSGCPATEVIERAVGDAINAAGLGPLRVIRRLAPPWTTDWISDEGRRKLRQHGIAPPGAGPGTTPGAPRHFSPRPGEAVRCPHCGARDTELLAAFGSTPCKALRRCTACREPFEYFKPI